MADGDEAPYGSPQFRTMKVDGRHAWRLEREADELAALKLAEAEAVRRKAQEGKEGVASPRPRARAAHRHRATRRRGRLARPRRQRRQDPQVTASR